MIKIKTIENEQGFRGAYKHHNWSGWVIVETYRLTPEDAWLDALGEIESSYTASDLEQAPIIEGI